MIASRVSSSLRGKGMTAYLVENVFCGEEKRLKNVHSLKTWLRFFFVHLCAAPHVGSNVCSSFAELLASFIGYKMCSPLPSFLPDVRFVCIPSNFRIFWEDTLNFILNLSFIKFTARIQRLLIIWFSLPVSEQLV